MILKIYLKIRKVYFDFIGCGQFIFIFKTGQGKVNLKLAL